MRKVISSEELQTLSLDGAVVTKRQPGTRQPPKKAPAPRLKKPSTPAQPSPAPAKTNAELANMLAAQTAVLVRLIEEVKLITANINKPVAYKMLKDKDNRIIGIVPGE